MSRCTLSAMIGLLALAPPSAAEVVCFEEVAPGVDWCASGEGNLQEEVHWAIVDLTTPELYIRVTRDDEGPLTASQEAAAKQSTVTINGDWDSASYDGPQGLSVGNGWHFEGSQDWDNNNPAGDWSFLACDAAKTCRINPQNVLEAWTWSELNVIGGNGQRLVIDGVLQAPSYDSCTRPRSGVCLDITGEVMTLFVAEGDNSCSSNTGWTPWDFAQFVYDHGCYNGLMLDGGGSSDLVINQVHVTDRPPSEPAERSTHNHLSIIHHTGAVDPLCAEVMNGRRCNGDILVTCQGGVAESGDCSFYGATCEEGLGTAYCVFEPYCPNGANADACMDATLMNQCSLGQPTEFDCANLFGSSCENAEGGARCIQYGCIYGGDTSWCDGEVAKTCAPDDSGDLVVSFLTEIDCAATGKECKQGLCVLPDDDDDGYPGAEYGGNDCDDANPAINPGASEVCDGVDNDCNGQVDDEATGATTWYLDLDGDGYGNPAQKMVACDQPPAYVDNGLDCEDTNFEAHPGHDETCNLADDDCDGQIDEDATNMSVFYLDTDGDGFGDPGSPKEDCFVSEGWVSDASDCDDTDAETHPEAPEIADDGVDQDCDGEDSVTPPPEDTGGAEGDAGDSQDTGMNEGDIGTPEQEAGPEDTGSAPATDTEGATPESAPGDESDTEVSDERGERTSEPGQQAPPSSGLNDEVEVSTRLSTPEPPAEPEAEGCQGGQSSPASILFVLILLLAYRRQGRCGRLLA